MNPPVDLLLVRPGVREPSEAHWAQFLPLGPGYLAASARKAGLTVAVLDAKLDGHTTLEQTFAALRRHTPRVVGFSALTIEYPSIANLAERLKAINPAVCTVLGGAHANALPELSLEQCPALDYSFAGEAELGLVELVQAVRNHRSPAHAPGLYSRGLPPGTASGRPVVDPSQLPFPAWDLFPRRRVYPVLTERGCPCHCVFCCRNLTHTLRPRPVRQVIEELTWLQRDFAPVAISFEDDTFGWDPERAEQLLEALVVFNSRRTLRFKAQTRVDRLPERLLGLMRRAGFEYLELGVESGDSEVLARSGKGIQLDQVERAVRAARQAGIRVWLKFILGLPGETHASVRRTIDLAVRLNPDRLSVSTIVPYPGSRIYAWAQRGEHGYRLRSNDWSRFDKYTGDAVELETLDARTLRRLQGRMYAEVYLRNFRLSELLRLAWHHQALARAWLRRATA